MWIETAAKHRITDPADWAPYLAPVGIATGQWPVAGLSPALALQASVDPGVHPQILDYFAPQLTAIKREHGYLSEDIVSLSPQTPNLEGILDKFRPVHHHTDDEVRVVLSGEGIFGIVPPEGEPYEIHVEAGDLIIVPAYTRHWFDLKASQQIVALRIFMTSAGWTAIYEAPETVPQA
jgi:1,2-dihydroxy-3-keto-5-methylthiopentene dioxygenase